MALTRVTQHQINTKIFGFDDPIVPINASQTGINNSDIGLVFNRGSLKNTTIYWDEFHKQFTFAYTNDDGTTHLISPTSYAPILSGAQTISEGNFQTHGDAVATAQVLRNVTAGTALTELFLDGDTRQVLIGDNTVVTYEILVTAKRTDEGGHGAAFKIVGAVGKDTTADSVFMIGTPSITTIGRTNEIWTAQTGVDTATGALTINVSGSLGNTVAWVAKITTTEVKYG